MSSDPRKPGHQNRDAELETFLQGEHALSHAYKQSDKPEPPADLDALILDQARRELPAQQRPHRLRRWQTPLALAAVLTLSLGLLLRLWQEPQVQQPVADDAGLGFAELEPDSDSSRETAPHAPLATQADDAAPASTAASKSIVEKPKRESRKPAARATRPGIDNIEAQSAQQSPPAPAAAAAAPSSAFAESMSDLAGAATPESAAADRDASLLHEQASRREARRYPQPLAAIASARLADRKAAQMDPHQIAAFEGLLIGETTQAQVRARYGQPAACVSAKTSGFAEYPQAVNCDHYDQLPGHGGRFEFDYDTDHQKLRVIRRQFEPAIPLQQLIDQLGWTEAAVIDRPTAAPCDTPHAGGSAHAATASGRYRWYPARGAYLLMSDESTVAQLVYAPSCVAQPTP